MKTIIEKLGITPGPWKWFGWYSKGRRNTMTLSTTHSGRVTVMDCTRAGTQGALPRFQSEKNLMGRVDELGELRDHNGEYTLTHPDANLIAAAPEMLERDIKFEQAMWEMCDRLNSGEKLTASEVFNFLSHRWSFLPDEKATGKTWEQIKNLHEEQ
jgi:hypothetical protein